MSDVARRVGVDLSTVSRVLNRSFDGHTYAPDTVARIREAADALGYQPSLAARSLRTGKTMLLGVLVSDIGNPFFSELASSLDDCMGEHGYRLVISNTSEDPSRQADHIDGMLAHGVDGLIVSPSGKRGLSKAAKIGVPVVTIDRPLREAGFSYVGLDNAAAGRLLARKLKIRGYRHIGVVVPEIKTDLTFHERLAGLREGLKTEGCALSWTVRVPAVTALQNEARKAVEARLEKAAKLPDAVVGLSNVCTLGIIEALADLGLDWGTSLGVAGIDDFSAAPLVRPSISVVAQPTRRIAAEAFGLLLKLMEVPLQRRRGKTVRIKPIWMERESLPKRERKSG